MKLGTIKVNPITHNPILCVENGRVLWGGTKRERKGYDIYDIQKSSIDVAFKNLDKKVKFTLVENRFGETEAVILYK